MDAPRVLSVGQCGFDSGSIKNLFERKFGAVVDSVDNAREAQAHLTAGTYGLVLINRRLDADGSSGITLLEQLHLQAPAVPLMLISDRADAQAEAVEKGALEGFGKSELKSDETAARIRAALEGSGR